jgi:hypothetical protein
MPRSASRPHGSTPALGAALLALACGACQPPDGIYDLVGNEGDTCGPGSVAEIADDFDDDTKADVWAGYADPSASIAEVNGQVEMRVDGSTPAFAGYAWLGGPRSLLGCHVSVQMKQVGSTAGGVFTYLSVPSEAGTAVGDIAFTHVGSSITMSVGGGGASSSQSIPYDPVEQAFWRVREAGGAIHFETSSDGASWLPQFTADTPSFAGTVSVNIGMGVNEPVPGGGFAVFDHLNVEP